MVVITALLVAGTVALATAAPTNNKACTESSETGKQTTVNTVDQIPIIFDMDADTDDITAFVEALSMPDVIDIRGVAVSGVGWGNGGPGAMNCLDLADHMQKHKKIPVAIGPCDTLTDGVFHNGSIYQSSVPEGAGYRLDNDLLYGAMRQVPRSRRIWRDFNDPAGPGKVSDHIASWIDDTIKETGKKPYIFMSGPATDIAMLFTDYPTYTDKIERIVWMAGAVDVVGNLIPVAGQPTNTAAEYNAYIDCIATSQLLANKNLKLTMVPLDFTNDLVLDATFFSEIKSIETFAAQFIYLVLNRERIGYGDDKAFYEGYSMWDVQAASIFLPGEEVVTEYEKTYLKIQCGGYPDPSTDGKLSRTTEVGATVMLAKKQALGKDLRSDPVFVKFKNAIAGDKTYFDSDDFSTA